MDPAGQRNLDEEPDPRGPELNPGQKPGDGVGGLLPVRRGRRHVQLLFDDGGTDRGKADHERDGLQMFRFPEQLEGPSGPDTALLLRCRAQRLLAERFPADHQRHHGDAQEHHAAADQQQVYGPQPARVLVGDERAEDAAQRRPSPDESKKPFGLPGVVHNIGHSPELADQQNTQDQSEQIEGDRDPPGIRAEQEPEAQHQTCSPRLTDGDGPSMRQAPEQPGVTGHEQSDQQACGELDIGKIVRTQFRDKLRSGNRLDHVVARHRQERVAEHQKGGHGLVIAHLGDGPQYGFESRSGHSHPAKIETDSNPARNRDVRPNRGGPRAHLDGDSRNGCKSEPRKIRRGRGRNPSGKCGGST